ncbi:hypothetical protein OICFNHDK_3812 [Methylobacterium bullatum]|uniref:KfrA N-terminal DNA-binding domain-containing protein n=2 Tax=Methylobacterium bullatum TaxID=570505 RepID=A0AAV4ZB28_9HYPH|nr:hypothetical protein OICFNHDK_3812 [Methylobacterium bullatum]
MPPLTDKAASFARTETEEGTVGDVPEMVERVARAIWDAENSVDGDTIGTMIHASDVVQVHGDDKGIPAAMEVCRTIARAAIAAMREPTDEMRYAGWFNRLKFRGETDEAAARMAIEKVRDHRQSWEDLSSYRTSIDAALGNAEVAR